MMRYRLARDLKPEDYATAIEWAKSGARLRVAELQRHFGDIGYNAACTLMERLEDDGVVSRCDHLGRRKLLAKVTCDTDEQIRCAECDCAHGGADCNWIKQPDDTEGAFEGSES